MVHTISSLHIGQSSFWGSDLDELAWRPTLIFVARSCDRSGRLADGAGDPVMELRSPLTSDGGTGLPTLGRDGDDPPGDAEGASPLPEPKILPPPSLRPDMVAASWRGVSLVGGREGGAAGASFFGLIHEKEAGNGSS